MQVGECKLSSSVSLSDMCMESKHISAWKAISLHENHNNLQIMTAMITSTGYWFGSNFENVAIRSSDASALIHSSHIATVAEPATLSLDFSVPVAYHSIVVVVVS